MHASKVGTDTWLGKVTGGIPEEKLKEFEKEFEKQSAGAVVQAGGAVGAREGSRDGAGESDGVATVTGAGERGQGVAGAAAQSGSRFKRLRRAGFAVANLSEGGVEEVSVAASGGEGSSVMAPGRGGGRVVSGFGAERVEDVRALEERRDEEACGRQRQRREEGARGRMVDFRGRELERNEGGAFSLRK